jgi:hypothetical protein
MADRRDEAGSWLAERIEPLPPPPGTFELISQRARRRKYRKLAITAACGAVVVAAAVTVPQVVSPRVGPSAESVAQAGRPASAGPSRVASAAPSAGTAAVGATADPVPGNFGPSSVTFVSSATGWVIGQAAGGASCAARSCTSVARTGDGGRSWSAVHAPAAGPPDGATGVGEIRFGNLQDGWAFGPGLFVTHDGGQDWTQVDTHGLRVTDLEAVGGRAFALFASCAGGGTAFAAHCTRFTLYSSPAGGAAWTPVGAATTGLTDGAASEAASLVLTSSRGYLLGPDGSLYSGPADGSGAWARVSPVISTCHVGSPQAGGQPAGVLLAAVSARDLVMACTVAGGAGQTTVLSSPNGGISWLQMGTPPAAGAVHSLAASPSESLVLGTSTGIAVLPAGEIAWHMATLAGSAPAGGFSYVGMTTDKQGIAIPANPGLGAVWFSYDGGQSWKPSKVSGT